VIRGDVSRAWADHHHHSWYQQVLRESDETSGPATTRTGAGD
jgi:cytochrome b subunit of formate dehydrogenase